MKQLFLFFLLFPFCLSAQNNRQQAKNATIVDKNSSEAIIFKDNNPLNGVTTFDLLLITKHILGVESLDSPYKIIAADVDESQCVSSSDVYHLRKLILGITHTLPNTNTSWRFIAKDFIFPNPANPFLTTFDESITDTLPLITADFVAIKVGDVNNSASVCSNCTAPRLAPAKPFVLTIPDSPVKAGEYVTIPITANDEAELIAWQLGLRFDANRLELIGPAAGDLADLSADNFGLTQSVEGLLRASWVARLQDEEAHLNNHSRLFYLTFRAKNDLADISALVQLDDAVLSNRGWLFDGTEYKLEMQGTRSADRSLPQNELLVSSRPNPAGNEAWLDFSLAAAGPVRLSVYNAFGVRMLFREVSLSAGAQTLALPELGTWSPGIYRYDLRVGKARAQGHLVKQ